MLFLPEHMLHHVVHDVFAIVRHIGLYSPQFDGFGVVVAPCHLPVGHEDKGEIVAVDTPKNLESKTAETCNLSIVVDDMIASGESVLDIAMELKERKVRNVYVATTFAFFTEGLEKFNRFYEDGIITRVYSTNLTYISDELRNSKWYRAVDMSELVSKIINKLNYDKSIASYMDATRVIRDLIEE